MSGWVGDDGFGPASEACRACQQCGLISTLPWKRTEGVATCSRCRNVLWRMRPHPFELPLACGLAGAMFYCFALIAPFITISAYGRFQLAEIETGPEQLMLQGFALLGLLVMLVSVVLPGVKLAIMLVTLIGLRIRILPPRLLKRIFRWYAHLTPWAMIDVYLLGIVVAYTRLATIATVHLDTALYALIGLMLTMAAADASLDHEAVWRALDRADGGPHAPPLPALEHALGCHACGLVNAPARRSCARCGTRLHARKHDSANRSWAFLIAAAVFYLPANLYPVMSITELGQATPYTIMGGIHDLLIYGLWPLAALVFFASIFVPLAKMLILGYLLVQAQRGSATHRLGRTRAFRIIEFIGRWSMIDVFMISILLALVRFEQFTSVQAEIGAPCFAAVVVLTMFAVDAFDPRLTWDAKRMPV